VTLRFFSNRAGKKALLSRSSFYLLGQWDSGSYPGYLELKRGWLTAEDAAWGCLNWALLARLPFTRDPCGQEFTEQRPADRGTAHDNLSPVLFTLAITLMGLRLHRSIHGLGIVSILAALRSMEYEQRSCR